MAEPICRPRNLSETGKTSTLSGIPPTAVRGGVWNKHLPYADAIPEEARENLEIIFKGLAETVAHRILRPGINVWCLRIGGHVQLYKYAFTMEQHVRLVELMFQILQLKDLDDNLVERVASTLRRLLRKKDLLPNSALEVDWRHLYEMLNSRFFGKMRQCAPEPKRSVGDALVKLCRESRRFFAPTATQEILATLRPQLCPHDEIAHHAVCFLSLLLPTDELSAAAGSSDFLCWFDEVMEIWQWMNNHPDWDFCFTTLFSRVALEAPTSIGFDKWKPYLPWMINRVLSSFFLPVGSQSAPMPPQYKMPAQCVMLLPSSRSRITKVAIIFVHLMGPENDILEHLRRMLEAMKAFFHPSNTGQWTHLLSALMYKLVEVFATRVRTESRDNCGLPPHLRLHPGDIREFVLLMKPYVFLAQFSKSTNMVTTAAWALRHLAYLCPNDILPPVMERVYPALETLTETHQTFAALSALAAIVRPLLLKDHFEGGLQHLIPLLQLTLPGIDPNDGHKTHVTLHFLFGLFMNITLVDCSEAVLAGGAATQGLSDIDREVLLGTSYFEDWALQFLDRIFSVLETMVPPSSKGPSTEGSLCEWIVVVCERFFQQSSPAIQDLAGRKVLLWVQSNIILHLGKTAGRMCNGVVKANPGIALPLFLPALTDRIMVLLDGHDLLEEAVKVTVSGDTPVSAATSDDAALDDELLWLLNVLSRIITHTGAAVLPFKESLVDVLVVGLRLKAFKAVKLCGKMLRHLLRSLTSLYPLASTSLTPAQVSQLAADPVGMFQKRGFSPDVMDVDAVSIAWHVPSEAEQLFADELMDLVYTPSIKVLQAFSSGEVLAGDAHDQVLQALTVVRNCVRVGPDVFPEDCSNGENPQGDAFGHFYDEKTGVVMQRFRIQTSMNVDDDTVTQRRKGRREEIENVMHSIVHRLLAQCEDDTKLLKVTIKILYQLGCVRGTTEEKYNNRARSWSFLKQGCADLVREGKQYSRCLLSIRINQQHLRRLNKRKLYSPYTPGHKRMVSDLIALGTSRYAIVRQRAQKVFSTMTSFFPFASHDGLKHILPLLLVSEAEMEEKHQQIKGTLHLLSKGCMPRTILAKSEYLTAFMTNVAGLHVNTRPTVQNLISQLFNTIDGHHRALAMGPLVAEESFHTVSLLYPPIADLADNFHGSFKTAAEEWRAKINAAATACELDLITQMETASFGWKFELIFARVLSNVIPYVDAIPDPVITYYVRQLKSDSLKLRQLCVHVASEIVTRLKSKPRKGRFKVGPDGALNVTDDVVPKEVPGEQDVLRPSAFGMRADNRGHCFKASAAERPTTKEAFDSVVFVDKNYMAWHGWPERVCTYFPMSEQRLTMSDAAARGSALVWEMLNDASYVEQVVKWFSQDKGDGTAHRFSNHQAELYKGLARNHGLQFMTLVRPFVEDLLTLVETDGVSEVVAKHRCAAELLAGIIRGAKHWPYDDQRQLWTWAIPVLRSAFDNATHFSVPEFATMLRYCVYDRDPRRFYALADLALAPVSFATDDGDTSFAQVRALELHVAVLEQLSWRGEEGVLEVLGRIQPHFAHPYKIVREKMARTLVAIVSAVWSPGQGKHASLEDFVDNTVQPLILAGRSAEKDTEAKQNAILAAKTLSMWVVYMSHEGVTQAFQNYIAQIVKLLMICPELTTDDDEMANLCRNALGYVSQFVMSDTTVIGDIFAAVFETCTDPSWHVRQRSLYFLQIFMFRNLFLVPKEQLIACVETCLMDAQLEVRRLASVTLSGMVRCGLANDDALREQFVSWSKTKIRHIKKRKRTGAAAASTTEETQPLTVEEKTAITRRHAGTLGLEAFITAHPYDIPPWMPATLVGIADKIKDPEPIKETVKKTLGEFWRTHQDDKQALHEAFDEDQLLTVRDLVIGYNYYA